MKKLKVISFVLLMIIVLNTVVPMVAMAVDETEKNANTQTQTDSNNDDNKDASISNSSENEHEEVDEVKDKENEDNINEGKKEEEDNNNINLDEEDLNLEEDNKINEDEESIEETQKKDQIMPTSDIAFSASVDVDGYTINAYLTNGIYYFFMPRNVNISELTINYTYSKDIAEISSGEFYNENKTIKNNFSGNNDTLTISFIDNEKYTIKVMQSDVASLCINLKNNVSLDTVNAKSKDEKWPSTLKVIGGSDSKYDITDNDLEFKGRGNSTWALLKRGYQIKLSKKQNLLGIGNGKSKKWVLLANYADRTMMKNKIVYDLGVQSKLTNIPNSEFIDLYVNGEYIGNYLLSDKIESGENRINLTDEKGVLVELDNAYYMEEKYSFISKYLPTAYVLKESYAGDNDLGESAEKAALADFEKSMNKFCEALINPNTKYEDLEKIVDIESFARLYLIIELSECPDALYSSTYFYKNGEKDVIHAGPVWDYDVSFGHGGIEERGGNPECDYSLIYKKLFCNELFEFNEFANLVNDIYTNELKEKFHNSLNNFDDYQKSMEKSVKMNCIRWGISYDKSYLTACNAFKNYYTKRVAYMDKQYSNDVNVQYKAHLQNKGWSNFTRDGQVSGTTGQNRALEAIRILTPTDNKNVHVTYQVHMQELGWSEWKKDGELAGTEGQGLQLEAIRIYLDGVKGYTIKYRVHIQDIGWQEWKTNGELAGTEGRGLKIEAIQIEYEKTNFLGNNEVNIDYPITYGAHIQDINWTETAADNEILGTMYQAKRIEAIKITAGKEIEDLGLKYRVHVQDIGWQDWKNSGEIAGTEGKSLRLEGIQIKLDNNKEGYCVEYRTYIENIGWQDWKVNGALSGTTGKSLRIEAIQIRITNKLYLGTDMISNDAKVLYQTHIEDYDWTKKGEDEDIIGTVGLAKRIEAIRIQLGETIDTSVKYRAHVQEIGWQDWKNSGEIAGTEGKSLRLEAIQIKLEDTLNYDIQYRVHVEDYGWMDWKSNGQMAGTVGERKRIEAIQIRIVDKNI